MNTEVYLTGRKIKRKLCVMMDLKKTMQNKRYSGFQSDSPQKRCVPLREKKPVAQV